MAKRFIVIDVGPVPSDFCSTLIRGKGFCQLSSVSDVYTHAHVPDVSRQQSLRTVLQPILEHVKQCGSALTWRGAFGLSPNLDTSHYSHETNRSMFACESLTDHGIRNFDDVDDYYVRRLGVIKDLSVLQRSMRDLDDMTVAASTGSLYIHLNGCDDIKHYSTCRVLAHDGAEGGDDRHQSQFRSKHVIPMTFGEESADHVEEIGTGKLPMLVADRRTVPRSAIEASVELSSEPRVQGIELMRRLEHEDVLGISTIERGLKEVDVVRGVKGVQHIASSCVKLLCNSVNLLMDRLFEMDVTKRSIMDSTHVILYGSGTIGTGSHNGTAGDPWNTRSFCMYHRPGQTEGRLYDRDVNLDEIVRSFVNEMQTRVGEDVGEVASLSPALSVGGPDAPRSSVVLVLGTTQRYSDLRRIHLDSAEGTAAGLKEDALPRVFFVKTLITIDDAAYHVIVWMAPPTMDADQRLIDSGWCDAKNPALMHASFDMLVRDSRYDVQLFDATNDPDEMNDVAADKEWIMSPSAKDLFWCFRRHHEKCLSTLTLRNVDVQQRLCGIHNPRALEPALPRRPPLVGPLGESARHAEEESNAIDLLSDAIRQWVGDVGHQSALTVFVPIGSQAKWDDWAVKPHPGLLSYDVLLQLARGNCTIRDIDDNDIRISLSHATQQVTLSSTARVVEGSYSRVAQNVWSYKIVRHVERAVR